MQRRTDRGYHARGVSKGEEPPPAQMQTTLPQSPHPYCGTVSIPLPPGRMDSSEKGRAREVL